ncbi:MAG: YHS domain-containing (seleno)protein [Acidobacteriota bacterium]
MALRVSLALMFLVGLLLPAVAFAGVDPVFTATFSDVAIRGYDPVAYFAAGEPVKGSDDFAHQWMGAEWRFASAENRDLFAADPEKYAPQYGGYCAYAVSRGKTASIDPEAWRIVDDKLYLNYNAKIQAQWEEDQAANIEKADEHWPRLLSDD